jgi:YVTN family beta-propeller protein
MLPLYVFSQEKDSIVYIHGKKLDLLTTITGRIAPKSVVANGKGLFFAQNMMYKHTVTVYNRNYDLVKTIPDQVKLSDYGHLHHKSVYKGAPVECVFTHGGKYAWVSNYEMTGGSAKEFSKPGCDACNSATKYDSSYVYKINTSTFEIEKVIVVGAVPKYLAATPNNEKVLVTNWSSGDVSVIDTRLNKEVKRISLGRFPRGIVINKTSSIAYIAIMGSTKIAKLNLFDYTLDWISDVGSHPRHLCLSPDNNTLYVSLNGEGRIAKVDLKTKKIIKKSTGRLPRSMDLSKDGKFLYVVNYGSNEVTKLETATMKIIAKSKTKSKPIGITFDDATKNIWTACYSGKIMVFHDTYYDSVAVNITEQEAMLAALKKEEEEARLKKIKVRIPKSSKPIENKLINGKYILVSGSFSTSSGARRRVAELKRKGVKANLYYNAQNGRNYAYIGAFYSIEEAKAYANNQPVESWVYTLPKEAQRKSVEKEEKSNNVSNEVKPEISNVPITDDLPFIIVSGSFQGQKNAETRVKQLKRINAAAFIYYNSKNGNYYACLGSFQSREEAVAYLKTTSEEGWVFKR